MTKYQIYAEISLVLEIWENKIYVEILLCPVFVFGSIRKDTNRKKFTFGHCPKVREGWLPLPEFLVRFFLPSKSP